MQYNERRTYCTEKISKAGTSSTSTVLVPKWDNLYDIHFVLLDRKNPYLLFEGITILVEY